MENGKNRFSMSNLKINLIFFNIGKDVLLQNVNLILH